MAAPDLVDADVFFVVLDFFCVVEATALPPLCHNAEQMLRKIYTIGIHSYTGTPGQAQHAPLPEPPPAGLAP